MGVVYAWEWSKLKTYPEFDPSKKLGVLTSNCVNRADLLVAINNAARLLSHQGKYAEAERMHRDALVKTEKLMGSVRVTKNYYHELSDA